MTHEHQDRAAAQPPKVCQRADKDGISHRMAAHELAVGHVVEASTMRGLYP